MTARPMSSDGSALITFRAENVRSFRDQIELSMLATSLSEPGAARLVPWREGGRPIKILPVAGIFGANASGKTNALRVMDDMRGVVLHSFRSGSPSGGMYRKPFGLDPSSRRRPSRFEVDIVLNGVRHQYGFLIDDDRVLEEWAYRYPKGKTALLFHRHDSDIELGSSERSAGRAVQQLLRPNALFLSTAASANHKVLLPLYEWFGVNLRLAEAGSRMARQAITAELLDDPVTRNRVVELLRAADLGITGATKRQLDPETKERLKLAVRILTGVEGDVDAGGDSPDFDEFDLQLTHRTAAGDVEMDAADESLGTLVWFGLVGPVILALANGSVLLADEIDASLHPALVERLIRLFQDRRTNPRHAQLIFNSHDITILGDSAERLIGRDQIWFTEKLRDGNTRIYSLAELRPRKEEAIGKRYLEGRYGATPILSDHEFTSTVESLTRGPAK